MSGIQTYDVNDLTLSTSDPDVTQLNLAVSSSLMTNYEPSRSVDSQHSIQVAQDVNGNPMVFSIGTENELYVILRTDDPKAPWSQTNLTAGLGSGWQVQTFGLLQTPQQTVVLALGIKDSGGGSHFYLTGALSNDPTDAAWTTDFTPRWVERAFSQGFTSIDHVLMAVGPGATAPPIVVATATLPSGEAQRFYVNGDVTSQVNLWEPWPVPQNASAILDIAPGSMPVLGAGSFVLYKVGSALQLDFTKAQMMNGQYISRSFTPPPGATALDTLQNADGTLDLYIAGNGIYVFTSQNMGKGAVAAQIGSTVAAGTGTEIAVRQDSGNIAVWVLDEGVLYYMHGTKGTPVTWTTPVPIQGNIGQIAALRNTVRDTNELFVVTADEQLAYFYQDPVTTLWKEMLIPLADVGSALPYSCYTTQLTLTDQNGNPVVKPFSIGATDWTYLTVNGGARIVDQDAMAPVTPDPTGRLTVISKVSTISTPTLQLAADFLDVVVDINPQAVVNGNLQQFTTEAALTSATTQSGQPVISGPTQIPVSKAAGALGQLTTLHDAAVFTQPGTGGKTGEEASAAVRTRAPEDPPSNRIDATTLPESFGFAVSAIGSRPAFHELTAARAALPELHEHGLRASAILAPSQALVTVGDTGDEITAFFGDIMQSIENGLEQVGSFLVQVANDVATFTMTLADKTISFLLDTVEKVMRVIGWVLQQIAIALEKVLDWLGFIFNWDDILTAHRIIVNVANKGFEYVEDKIADAKTIVAGFFDDLKEQLGNLPASLSGSDAGASVLGQSQNPGPEFSSDQKAGAGYFKSPGGNFANYHLQHSGILDATPPNPPPPPSGNPIVDVFTQVIEPVGEDIGTTVEDIFVDLRDGFVSGTLTPDQALAKLKTDAALGVLNTAEDASEGALTVADDLVTSLQGMVDDPWDIPFLSPLYSLITGGSELTLLDATALLIAIPGVPLYKLVSERSPFADGTMGLDDTSIPGPQFFANLAAGSTTPAPHALAAGKPPRIAGGAETEPADILYSQIGGCFYVAAEVVSLTMDAIEAESEEETPTALYYIHLACELVMQAGSYPVGDGSAVVVLRILWGFYWAAALRFVALIISKGALAKPVGIFELFFALVKAIAFLVAIFLQTVNDSGTELALEWETFFGNLLDAISRGISGAAKIDPDKEISGLALDVIAVWVTVVAILFDVIRLSIILSDDEYKEFHAF